MELLNPRDVTVLWHGWLKKLGRFSKRWKRRYFVFLSTANGLRELRHYDAQKDVMALLASTPKGVIAMTDATGICCFLPPSPSAVSAKKHSMFNLKDAHDANAADIQDQKFAVLTPLVGTPAQMGSTSLALLWIGVEQHVHMLAFQSGREWANASESQQGLALLASLSAFYPAVDVLHTGFMSKKRERTVHTSAKNSIISYWKRHFFVFLSSGDLLYFKDETLGDLQGRVDVRHAPTVRVTGERMLEEKKKEISALLLKLTKLPGGSSNDREHCLVWIATPPSKMFVLKLQEDNAGVTADGRRQELTPTAKRWMSLLLQGHAETKFTQLEQCISMDKFDATPEIISAVRAGIPDELRGAMWKGFSGAVDLQRRAELKRTIRKVTKTFNIRTMSSTSDGIPTSGFFDELSGPIDANALHLPENMMIFSRLCAIATHEVLVEPAARGAATSIDSRTARTNGRAKLHASSMDVDDADDASDSELPVPVKKGGSLKQVEKSRMGHYVYPSEAVSPEWEILARRRLLIATSRFNPYSHPCPWKVACLLLAYLDEDSAFWVINSIQDVYLPGYFHGYRPALQIDVSAFCSVLEDRASTLFAHLKALALPIDRIAERWLLSLFTSTFIPLPTVLRVWDAFFAQGVRVLYGVGIAIFLRAEDHLFRAKSAAEALDILDATERASIDADALFSHSFKDDLNMSWLSVDRFEKVRSRHRQKVIEQVSQQLSLFRDKLSILSQLQDQFSRVVSTVKPLQALAKSARGHMPTTLRPSSSSSNLDRDGEEDDDEDESLSMESSLSSLQACLKAAINAISKLASDLNSRQARWLALSSQLAGCPLSRGTIRLTSDLQSWLSQVKEGKISGAGLDALPDEGHTRGFSLGITPRAADLHEMLFDDGRCSETHGSVEWSCLVARRDEFQSDDRLITDFLYTIVSAIKAACATRLECLAVANRMQWHGSFWIETPIEFLQDSSNSPDGRARSASRGLRRSVSNAGKQFGLSTTPRSQRNPRTFADDADQPTTRNSLDDTMLRRRLVNETVQLRPSISYALTPVNEHHQSGPFSGGGAALYVDYDSNFYGSSRQSSSSPVRSGNAVHSIDPLAMWQDEEDGFARTIENARSVQQLSAQYRQAEEVMHSAVDSVMSCFSRFIRVETRHNPNAKWELRERALLLEDDLVQELNVVQVIVQSTKELY